MAKEFIDDDDEYEAEKDDEETEEEGDEVDYLPVEYEDLNEIATERNKLNHEFLIRKKEYENQQGLLNLHLIGDPNVPQQKSILDRFEFIMEAPTIKQTVIAEQGKALATKTRELQHSYATSDEYYKSVITRMGKLLKNLYKMYEEDIGDKEEKQPEVKFEVTTEAYQFMETLGKDYLEKYIEAVDKRDTTRKSTSKSNFMKSARIHLKNHPKTEEYCNNLWNDYLKKYMERYLANKQTNSLSKK